MKLIWAGAAVSQLAAIHDYISRTSPLYLGSAIGFAEEGRSRSARMLRLWRTATGSGVAGVIQLTATDTSLSVDLGVRSGVGASRPDAVRAAEQMREQCGRAT